MAATIITNGSTEDYGYSRDPPDIEVSVKKTIDII